MNIFYAADNNFVPQLGAGLCSVCENNKNSDEINFFIGGLNISDKNRELLLSLGEKYGRKVFFRPIDQIRDLLGFDFDTFGWNEITLARLLLDRLLPDTVDRVLYLDCDTIVLDDLHNLWSTDMEGSVLGAVIEPTANHARKKDLGLEFLPYYNCGVLLIDFNKWRKENTGKQILDFYRSRNGRLFANDQDAINGALPGEIYTLSPKYNYFNIFDYYSYHALSRIQSPASFISEEVFKDAQEHPCIIHYLGEDRPWRKGNTHNYSKEYQKYLSLTPWKGSPMEEGWELYFKCYKLFLTLTKPVPMLRYKIFDSLIPLFMKYRKAIRIKKAAQKE